MLKDSKTDMDFHTIFSKTYPSFFIDKAGCTQQFESELSMRSFAQLFPFKKAPPLSPSLSSIVFTPPSVPLIGDRNPQEREDVTALRCSEPLRSKVGGPSEVYASSRDAVFFVRG